MNIHPPPATACPCLYDGTHPHDHTVLALSQGTPLLLCCRRTTASCSRAAFTWTTSRKQSTSPWQAPATAVQMWTGCGRHWPSWQHLPCRMRSRAEGLCIAHVHARSTPSCHSLLQVVGWAASTNEIALGLRSERLGRQLTGVLRSVLGVWVGRRGVYEVTCGEL